MIFNYRLFALFLPIGMIFYHYISMLERIYPTHDNKGM